ncbi:C-20 methyltransferase BchU [Serratia marcescens]|uniref:methyltransferase n=1 Tax=Serratia marcescens TaxID=615 RepID=UPI00217A30F2|nr:class I SAM-dependent methyltransferase [Serratia marcescens]CAI0784326.1 C-20 methyltransferase BchU [Serratia marcescens]CAI0917788.1 C-20 methyltransferase BchU [Serratia marcescens]
MYEQDTFNALDAITEAQRIAFAPMLFQTALCLRNGGVLAYLDKQGEQGAFLDEIVANSSLNDYATSVLLDMGLSGRIITCRDERYRLSKVGHFLLHDAMTRVNMDFTQDVCYQGLFFLAQALKDSKPAGLQVFSDTETIYPVLSQLPSPARESWFAFDHYYSDAAFSAALPHIFAGKPLSLYDVGGNTGKWALRCCQYDDDITITILDLPQQIALARQNVENAGFSHRIGFHAVDMLKEATLPGEADIWWMSQFLDCFAPQEIIGMLERIAKVMKPGARLCVMELFWDAQKFEAASFSLNATSLYFTCMANGNSRFYSVEKFYRYLEAAGFEVEQRVDHLGVGHTLLICKKI